MARIVLVTQHLLLAVHSGLRQAATDLVTSRCEVFDVDLIPITHYMYFEGCRATENGGIQTPLDAAATRPPRDSAAVSISISVLPKSILVSSALNRVLNCSARRTGARLKIAKLSGGSLRPSYS